MCLFSKAAFFATFTVLATAAPQRLLARPHAEAKALLQGTEEGKDKKPAFNHMWFAEDQRRMEQMPPYVMRSQDPPYGPDGPSSEDAKAASGSTHHMPGDPICSPKCGYSCGHSECDQVCEPVCLPPACETLCAKAEDKCSMKCAKPKCAVICPSSVMPCANGDCPKCRTLCAPPACTTSCSPGSCHSVCTQPQCSWKCKAGKCPKPKCKMTCTGFDKCHDQFHDPKVPIMPGLTIMAEDRASMDPMSITKPAVAPPLKVPQVVTQKADREKLEGSKESSLGYQDVPLPKTTPGPVTKLKMKWQAQDTLEENERLLRR